MERKRGPTADIEAVRRNSVCLLGRMDSGRHSMGCKMSARDGKYNALRSSNQDLDSGLRVRCYLVDASPPELCNLRDSLGEARGMEEWRLPLKVARIATERRSIAEAKK